MLQQVTTIGDQILEVVRAHPDCMLEEVTQQLPELHWSEVFIEVDRLSRLGHVRITQSRFGLTATLRLP
jgi:hypothetical protein